MYLLTIRDGLHTRHIGPFESPSQASEQLDQLLAQCSDRANWQIHALEPPLSAAQGLQAVAETASSFAA
jgi:hypothetical protein